MLHGVEFEICAVEKYSGREFGFRSYETVFAPPLSIAQHHIIHNSYIS